jgi:hypothetical protein
MQCLRVFKDEEKVIKGDELKNEVDDVSRQSRRLLREVLDLGLRLMDAQWGTTSDTSLGSIFYNSC